MKKLNIISTYDQGNFTNSTKTNVILHKQQYRKIRKRLGNSDPAWVRYTDVFFNDEKTAVFEMKSMIRHGLYVFGYLYPALNDQSSNSKIFYLLESDLNKDLHVHGKIPKSKKGRLFLKWRVVLNENIREINYAEYPGGRFALRYRYSREELLISEQSARELNISKKRRGMVRVVDVGPGLSFAEYPGYKRFSVSTRGRSKTRELSACLIGPIKNPPTINLYTLWMNCRINNIIKKPQGGHIYYSDNFYRYKGKTLFYYWSGKKLNEIEARKEIFCPFYVEFAVQTDSFQKIKKILKDGYNVQLIAYDATPYSTEYDPDGQILKDIFNDPSKPFTNAHVLAGLLTKNHVWE